MHLTFCTVPHAPSYAIIRGLVGPNAYYVHKTDLLLDCPEAVADCTTPQKLSAESLAQLSKIVVQDIPRLAYLEHSK